MRIARSETPSPLKSAAWMTTGAAVGKASALENRPSPRGRALRGCSNPGLRAMSEEAPARRERHGNHARRPLERRDRCGRVRASLAVGAAAGEVDDWGRERPTAEVLKHHDLAREPVRNQDVELPAVLEGVGHCDIRGSRPDRHRDRRLEPAVPVAHVNREGAVAGIADVRSPQAPPSRLADTICAGAGPWPSEEPPGRSCFRASRRSG